MTDINRITLTGRVGQEPEFKAFDSGSVLAKFTLACNRYNTKQKEDVTDWFNVETFSKLAEYVKKGNLIAVDGRLQTSSWEDDEGNKKKRTFIFAENLQILTPKKDKNTENSDENFDDFETEMN